MSERIPRESGGRQSQVGPTTTTSGGDSKAASSLLAGKPFEEQEAALCVRPSGRDELIPPWKRGQNKPVGTPQPAGPVGQEGADHTPAGPEDLRCNEDPTTTRAVVRDIVSVDLGDAVAAYIRDLCHAEARAMNRFIHATGGSPGTSLGQADFFGLVADVVTGGLVQEGLTSAAKRSGHLQSKLTEMLFGTVTGVAWGLLASLIFDDNDDELVHLALVSAGQRAQEAFDKIHNSGLAMTERWKADRGQVLDALTILKDVEPMKAIESWARREIDRLHVSDKNGELLYGQLLERWLLERAKNDEDAGRGVNQVSHEAARPFVQTAGARDDRAPVTDGKRITKSDLFLNQMAYQLSKVGLGAGAATEFFGRWFQELQKGNTPSAVAAIMKRETYLVRETADEKRWHGVTTWTHYRAPDRVLEPPGANSAMEVRLDLKAHSGVVALKSMELTYVRDGRDGEASRGRTMRYAP